MYTSKQKYVKRKEREKGRVKGLVRDFEGSERKRCGGDEVAIRGAFEVLVGQFSLGEGESTSKDQRSPTGFRLSKRSRYLERKMKEESDSEFSVGACHALVSIPAFLPSFLPSSRLSRRCDPSMLSRSSFRPLDIHASLLFLSGSHCHLETVHPPSFVAPKESKLLVLSYKTDARRILFFFFQLLLHYDRQFPQSILRFRRLSQRHKLRKCYLNVRNSKKKNNPYSSKIFLKKVLWSKRHSEIGQYSARPKFTLWGKYAKRKVTP